jgi:hypothetical protein
LTLLPLFVTINYHSSRGGAAAARVAHNHEVAGSSPAPATKPTQPLLFSRGFCLSKIIKKLIGSSPVRL